MKRIALQLALLISLQLLFSCNQDQIDQLSEENADYAAENARKDSSITEMLKTFNEIQANLNIIKEREGVLQISDPEKNEQDMVADIQLINQLMMENEKLNEQLNKQLKNSNYKVAELRKMVENLNKQIELKNQEIASLNQRLQAKDAKIGQLYFSVDSLQYAVDQKEDVIKDQEDELNTAYYAFGTFKELKEKNVLTKEGGFLGLGKTESLKDNVNMDYFTKIDIRKQKSFLIYADKAELITKHPEESYEFYGNDKVDSLVIKDVEAFWKAGKTLVIVVD
jgi:chromosome segregation ATPase